MKLPLSFGNRLFLRLLIPGALAAVGLLPALLWLDRVVGSDLGAEVIFGISTLLCGWLLSLFDMNVYMLFEGRRFWPSRLRRSSTKNQQDRLAKWLERAEKLDGIGDNAGAVEWRIRAYRYPIGDGRYPPTSGVPTAMMPTELGNVIYGYETYPTVKYGMDGMFFWDRIWIIADASLRTSFDDEQALCDSAVYCSFVSFLNAVLFITYGMYDLLSPYGFPFTFWVYFPSAVLSIIFWHVLYRAAIGANAQFGEKLKALFDIHVDKIPLDVPLSVIRKKTGTRYLDGYDPERTQAAWRYLRWHRHKAYPAAESKDIESVAKARRIPWEKLSA